MAWVPLALALLLGFCMPGPAADALRDVVNAWPGLR
jgi:hypothetical protein